MAFSPNDDLTVTLKVSHWNFLMELLRRRLEDPPEAQIITSINEAAREAQQPPKAVEEPPPPQVPADTISLASERMGRRSPRNGPGPPSAPAEQAPPAAPERAADPPGS